MVLDDPDSLGNIRRDVFRKLKVQSKVVFKSDIEQMQNLGSMDKCGVFVKIEKEEMVFKYLENILELNSFDQNIFKNLHWYIFLTREDNLKMVFRYDSNVYIILKDEVVDGVSKLVETYSIEEGVNVNKMVGKWSSGNGLGKREKSS